MLGRLKLNGMILWILSGGLHKMRSIDKSIITQEKFQKIELLGGGTPSEVRGYCARGDI